MNDNQLHKYTLTKEDFIILFDITLRFQKKNACYDYYLYDRIFFDHVKEIYHFQVLRNGEYPQIKFAIELLDGLPPKCSWHQILQDNSLWLHKNMFQDQIIHAQELRSFAKENNRDFSLMDDEIIVSEKGMEYETWSSLWKKVQRHKFYQLLSYHKGEFGGLEKVVPAKLIPGR